MSHHPLRCALLVRAALLVSGIAGLLSWSAGTPAGAWRALVSAAGASATNPGSDQLLGSSAALAAWVGLGWFGGALVLEVASTVPGATGRASAAVAARVSPKLLRRVVHAAIGVSVLAGPLTAGSAFAAGPSTSTSTSVDRPNSLLAGTPTAAPTTPLRLDRPAAAFVQAAPPTPAAFVPASPPTPVKRSAPGPAALVTGVTHRDASDPNDASARGYVVRRGDTLWDIAARHLGPRATAVDISREWPAWYDANRAVIGPDPATIRPGELLSPPSASAHLSAR